MPTWKVTMRDGTTETYSEQVLKTDSNNNLLLNWCSQDPDSNDVKYLIHADQWVKVRMISFEDEDWDETEDPTL